MRDAPYVHRERVRFRDRDAMGHVNNAVYSTYLEEARIGVLGDLGDVILARVEIDFRAELRMGEEVEVRTRCPRVGTKSFELEHVISAGGRVVAEARAFSFRRSFARG
jgi:acyl-CoA thioester hydrolase